MPVTAARERGIALSFFSELRRRNVFRVGIAYSIATWALLQIVDVIAPMFELPDWAPKLIFVILAVGFVPALIFAWAFELTPEGLKHERDVNREESITGDTGRKLDFIIIGVLALAIALLLVDRYIGTSTPEPHQVAEEAGEKSIAVLPFVNMSSDAEQEFFSDGITEEILNSLASVKELKVAGRTSSFAFKGQSDDLRKIGDTLGVEHILEGSVRKSGTKVRITAQLIQVEDGFHMWSETYDRELTDIFKIQDEIAEQILVALRARLLDEQLEAIASQPTSPEAYDRYLLAKQRFYGRTLPLIESGIELLDEAIALDPDYAPAFAQRGIGAMLMADSQYGSVPDAEAHRRAKRFIDRALELDPGHAEAWAALGLYHANRPTEEEQAIEALTRALSINPNLIDASNWLYIAFGETGQVTDALALIEDMVERDPLYLPAFGNSVLTLNNLGMVDRAQQLIDRYRRYDATNPLLYRSDAMQHLYAGSAAEGLRLAELALEQAPTDGVFRITVDIALLELMEAERLVAEGRDDGFKVFALDALRRDDEAYEIAYEQAEFGNIENLFAQFNRDNRSQDLVDYLEERWPSLELFAADYPRNDFGYSIMAEIAFAYSRTGNTERFEDALQRVALAHEKLQADGIDNWGELRQFAIYLAMAGRHEEAIDALENALKRGMQGFAPLAAASPMLAALADNPRFIEVEAQMIANVNADRAMLDLEPVEPYADLWR